MLRPRIVVSGDGLLVDCDSVIFDGVDFIWQAGRGATRPARSLVTLEAAAIEFRGCSFFTAESPPPVAIAWLGAGESNASGEIKFSDCASSGVAALVDCHAASSLWVEITNTLCVASGPLVRLNRAPATDQAVTISLDHVTTRGDSAVIECRYGQLGDACGPIAISAAECVLDCNPQGGLLVFSGSQQPDSLLRSTHWDGQGSLVTGRTAVALWRRGARRPEVLGDEALEVAGLVRGDVEFAGRAEGSPAASRVIRWQAPLRSANPPGANPDSLFLARP